MIFAVAAEILDRHKLTGGGPRYTAVNLPDEIERLNLPDEIRRDIARRPIPKGVHRVYNKAFKMPERPHRAD